MKIIKLTRPALTDPQRHLELQAREAQAGLMDFVLSRAAPSGWLEVEIIAPQSRTSHDTTAPHPLRRIG